MFKLGELSKGLSGGESKWFTLDDLISSASGFKIDRSDVEKWLRHAVQEGDVYSPVLDKYRSVR